MSPSIWTFLKLLRVWSSDPIELVTLRFDYTQRYSCTIHHYLLFFMLLQTQLVHITFNSLHLSHLWSLSSLDFFLNLHNPHYGRHHSITRAQTNIISFLYLITNLWTESYSSSIFTVFPHIHLNRNIFVTPIFLVWCPEIIFSLFMLSLLTPISELCPKEIWLGSLAGHLRRTGSVKKTPNLSTKWPKNHGITNFTFDWK